MKAPTLLFSPDLKWSDPGSRVGSDLRAGHAPTLIPSPPTTDASPTMLATVAAASTTAAAPLAFALALPFGLGLGSGLALGCPALCPPAGVLGGELQQSGEPYLA